MITDNNYGDRPLVSVGLMTYNHEKYIARAIESVLQQEVDFNYELVIAEDCSTDNTREIVVEYQKKYPNIIRLILQEENVGMKENSNQLRKACRGKYRANLEGDDYWIDLSKLQKQVDFLEQNEDFVAVGGDFTCVDEDGNATAFPWGDIRYSYCMEDEYTIEHMKQWLLFAHTSTMMFRNFFFDCGDEVNQRFDEVNMLGDRRICLFLVMQGRVRHMKEIWTVRRVLSKSKTSMTHAVKNSNYLGVNYGWMLEAERYCLSEFSYKLDLKEKKNQRWLGSLKLFFRNPNKENYDVMKYIFSNSPNKIYYVLLAIKAFIRKIIKTVKRDGFVIGVKKGLKKLHRAANTLYNIRTNRSSLEERKISSVLTSYSK